jgi:hypothetical protein
MVSITSTKATRLILGSTAVVAALVLSAGPAMATEISHSGRIGFHQLNNGPNNPGMVCAYDESTDDLVGFESVQPPTIFSRDKTSGRDKQKVGWRFAILRKHNNKPWKSFYQSSIVKADAWNDQSAFFLYRTPTNIMVPLQIFPNHDSYKLRITQYWYTPSGAVAGTALSQADTIAEAYQEGSSNPEYNELNTTCQNRFLH